MIIQDRFVGIDISKRHLDIFDAAHGRPERCPNGAEDAHALARRLSERDNGFAVFEATGEYDRRLRKAFDAAGVTYARVNPLHAKEFAKALGRRAKNDRLDAYILAAMGQALQLQPTPARDPDRERLAGLHLRRDQLVDTRSAERARATEGADPHGSIAGHLAWLDAEIARVDGLIDQAIKADPVMTEEARLMRSVPGVGTVTATTLLALMPELGTLTPKAAAFLAGLAPLDKESGEKRGLRHISGGRRRVRRALYMAAISAVRARRGLRPIYQQLRARGKPAKVALIAIARKLVIILNAILRDRTAYQYTAGQQYS